MAPVTVKPGKVKTFKDADAFYIWLSKNHASEDEVWIKIHKAKSGLKSITPTEAVDVVLCFGWIDGVRRKVDDESYSIRFSPRKPKSAWSAINIEKIAELTEKGLMMPAGIKAFEKRHEADRIGYRYREFEGEFPPEFVEAFRTNPAALEFFESQPPGYRRIASYWVMSAKREETRKSRLERLIEASAKRVRL